jgi:malate dehydrogenase (oxaloacetate-decarboxylating)
MQAVKDGVARVEMTWQEAFDKAKKDIEHARCLTRQLMDKGFIEMPPIDMIKKALEWAISQV